MAAFVGETQFVWSKANMHVKICLVRDEVALIVVIVLSQTALLKIWSWYPMLLQLPLL